MSMKQRLMKAARTQKQKKEVERMTEEQAQQFIKNITKQTRKEKER